MITLLRWRVRITIARYRRSPVLITGALVLVALFLLSVYASAGLFAVLTRLAPAFADGLLLAAYAAVGVFQILAGFRWGVTRLFLNSDLELLMVAPLPRHRLFGLKVFDLVWSSPISIAFLGSLTWGYGRAHHLAIAPLLAIVLPILLGTIAALPGMAIALLLARAMIGPRLRTLIGVISPLLPLAWVFFFSSASTFYGRVSQRQFDPHRLDELGRSMLRAVGRSPTSWPGDIVRAIAYGRWPIVFRNLGAIAFVGAGLVAITYTVFFATFETSWTRLAEASTKRRTGTLIERLAPPVPRVSRAIVVKEWRGFTRDLRLMQSLVFPLLLIGFFGMNAMRNNGESPLGFFWVVPFLISNQAASALLMERRNIGMLKLAPVRGIDILTGKAVAYTAPTGLLIAGVIVAFGIVRHIAPLAVVGLVVLLVWILVGCMFGGVGIAALWGKFDLERPRLGFLPVLVEMAVLVAFAGAQGALGFWIVGHIANHNPIAGVVFLVLAGGTVALVYMFTALGARRLETLDAP
jgi:hypothetical protein